MQSEKSISYIILVFILLIAAFNTIGSLYMMVIEKEQDLFVLSSMGLKQTQAALIYGIQSVMVAITGGIIGLTIGAFIAWGQEKYKWLSIQNSENIALNGYPILLKWEDIFSVLLTIVLMGIVTSAIPAMKAYKLISPQK
jgi:lipoprotein-releasing system permease protein